MKRISLLFLGILGLIGVLYLGCQQVTLDKPVTPSSAETIRIGTWNVRGYPEKTDSDRAWFTSQLASMDCDVICIQEIANQVRIDTFVSSEVSYSLSAFQDSSDGQDNAIFAKASITMLDIADPTGFQHPVQAAYVARDGFDAVIVTVHLSWTNTALREQEKAALRL